MSRRALGILATLVLLAGGLGAGALLTGAVDAGDGVRAFATKHAITAYRLS